MFVYYFISLADNGTVFQTDVLYHDTDRTVWYTVENCKDNKIVFSAFTRPEGRAVLVMVNDSNTTENIVLKLDCRKLLGKSAPAVIKDIYFPEKKYTFRDGAIDMSLSPREGRILILE